MNYRFLTAWLLLLTSSTVFSESSSTVSFNPTPGDVSMVFLGNIFGVVDGVLAGSGSQIIGQMFGVFNSAVLSLGGIILMYTLIFSSMNTAHEGQFLGQKWSSIWLPIRSTVGIALLLPKASGYCTMQIFVMWIIVQGIGAADSIWGAALSYLNRGGVIVQKQMSAGASVNAGGGAIMNAAMGITVGQVCMQATYQALNKLRDQAILNNKDCSSFSGNIKLCDQSIPDFMNSVNINDAKAVGAYIKQDMPFFDTDSDFNKLSGLCGTLQWKPFQSSNKDSTLSTSEQETLSNSRSIAVYQMYEALLPVSRAMLSNIPIFNPSINCDPKTGGSCVNSFAQYAYGQPLTRNYKTSCIDRLGSVTPTNTLLGIVSRAGSVDLIGSAIDDKNIGEQIVNGKRTVIYTDDNACTAWGTPTQATTLFSGNELQDAVAAYNGIMLPTLTSNELNGSATQAEYQKTKDFIREAQSKGWLMAGAYFFRLAILNSYVVQKTTGHGGAGELTDKNSGLKFGYEASPWSLETYLDKLRQKDQFNLGAGTILNIGKVIAIGVSPVMPSSTTVMSKSPAGNNVFTYLVNANSLVLPTQTAILDAGQKDFVKQIGFNPRQSVPTLGSMSFGGGKWGIPGAVTGLIWNSMLKPVWNLLLGLMIPPVMVLFSIIMLPMIGLTSLIFNNALDVMRIEGVNPILALANMGTRYIEGVGIAWMAIIAVAIPASFFPPAIALLLMILPIFTTWMGIMLIVGFSAAFYVPFIPLLIFTFAGIGWFIGVIEGMVAAPIVALGIMHPEGHESFGKSDQAMMLLLSMFLRPAMMILGYIFGIMLSYIGVWIMNAGFNLTIHDLDTLGPITKANVAAEIDVSKFDSMYGFWSNIFLFYFTILTYSTLYITIVQQAFEMIYELPDKVLRWLSGGQAESLGATTVKSMLQEVKAQSDGAGKEAGSAIDKVADDGLTKAGAAGKKEDE